MGVIPVFFFDVRLMTTRRQPKLHTTTTKHFCLLAVGKDKSNSVSGYQCRTAILSSLSCLLSDPTDVWMQQNISVHCLCEQRDQDTGPLF